MYRNYKILARLAKLQTANQQLWVTLIEMNICLAVQAESDLRTQLIIFQMYTDSIKSKKSNTFYQLKTITAFDEKDKVIEKLGGSIDASINRLQSLKASIMSASVGDLKPLIMDFQREHASFINKQKSLMQVEEKSEKIERLRAKVRDFLEVFTPDDIERRLQTIKQEHIRRSSQHDVMQRQEQIQTQKYQGESFRTRLLNEQDLELKEIERLMSVIKQVSTDLSRMVLDIGANINIAAQSMKTARLRIKEGREQLVEANKYEQDTNKVKIFLCALVTVIVIVLFLLFRASRK